MSLEDRAREWLEDIFGDLMPEDLTDAEVRAAIDRHYDGGWATFTDEETDR